MLPKSLTRIKKLKFDYNGGNIHSPEDGYSLTLPKGAIPEKLGSDINAVWSHTVWAFWSIQVSRWCEASFSHCLVLLDHKS